jgi:2-phospho-L-lactate guanylyltransferase
MWAVVPLKSPDQAKSRLAAVLNGAQRRHLFFALAEHVIRALQATRAIEAVAVVTSNAEVAAFARSLDAQLIQEPGEFGTSSAFTSAVHHLRGFKLEHLLMIAGDLPLVSPAALEQLAAAAGTTPGIVVVPDRYRVGTNALLCTPPEVVAPHFGADSFRRHLAAAEMAGVRARAMELEELALDLDVPEDLEYLRTRCSVRASLLLTPATRADATKDAVCSVAGVRG